MFDENGASQRGRGRPGSRNGPGNGSDPSSSVPGTDGRPSAGQITRLVQRWSDGDSDAFDRLIALVYDDLRSIARHHLDIGGRGTIDTTALVHELYLRISPAEEGDWPGRTHFFAFCSKAMRRILIDHARKRHAVKRGGTRVRVPLTDGMAVQETDVIEVLAVEEALQKLEVRDPRMAQVVECRFFGGLSVDETADALGTSPRTVARDWTRARAYLVKVLEGRERRGGG